MLARTDRRRAPLEQRETTVRAGDRPPARMRALLLGRWSVSPGNGIPDPPIRAYLSRVTSSRRAVALKPADVERLRALGYMGH